MLLTMLKNYFSLILLFCFFLSNIYSQTTYVPDNNFEQALIDLEYDDVLDDYVLTSNISGVTSLSVNSKNISDMTGIEDFISLTYLSCYSNSLTTLNVTQNTALTVLICRQNNLSSLDVSQNTSLGVLHCNNNQLTSLDVSLNTSLGDLKCHYNQLTELDVTQNTGLGVINCSYNQLTSLDLMQNPTLTNLVCSNNQLSGLNISQNTGITNLSCNNNQITSLDVSQLLGLVNLYCNDNLLTNLTMGQNTSLTTFYCFNNQVSHLDISQCTAITTLFCHLNQLTSIDVSQHTSLQYLRCYNNQLTVLDIKNGTNSSIFIFEAQNNTSLECIQVDDETAANASQAPYTNWLKDATTTYAEDCGYALSIEDEPLEKSVTLYPNPVSDIFTIESKIPLTKVEIYSILGQKVKEINSGFNSIPMDELSIGIYVIKLETEVGFVIKKLIKK